MRLRMPPQAQVVPSGSCRISRRGKRAGSAWLSLLALSRRHGRELFQLTLHRCQVSIDGLFQQVLLLHIESFGTGGSFQPFERGHLLGELGDGGLLERDPVGARCELKLVGWRPYR